MCVQLAAGRAVDWSSLLAGRLRTYAAAPCPNGMAPSPLLITLLRRCCVRSWRFRQCWPWRVTAQQRRIAVGRSHSNAQRMNGAATHSPIYVTPKGKRVLARSARLSAPWTSFRYAVATAGHIQTDVERTRRERASLMQGRARRANDIAPQPREQAVDDRRGRAWRGGAPSLRIHDRCRCPALAEGAGSAPENHRGTEVRAYLLATKDQVEMSLAGDPVGTMRQAI